MVENIVRFETTWFNDSDGLGWVHPLLDKVEMKAPSRGKIKGEIDFDGDGSKDHYICSIKGKKIHCTFKNAAGNVLGIFEETKRRPFSIEKVGVADVDQDGDADVVVQGKIFSKRGGIDISQQYNSNPTSKFSHAGINVYYPDNLRKQDPFRDSRKQVLFDHILQTLPNVQFQPIRKEANGKILPVTAPADLDGDGDKEWAGFDEVSHGRDTDGTPLFITMVRTAGWSVRAAFEEEPLSWGMADFNGDGLQDLAIQLLGGGLLIAFTHLKE